MYMYVCKKTDRKYKKKRLLLGHYSLVIALGPFRSYRLTLNLQPWSGWILSVAWWFYIFMFMCSFTANLASYLSFSRDRTRVRVIDDLEKLPYMK